MKLDAKSEFRQISLYPESRLLTTFITPFRRFCFIHLPFGISSAPKLFECMMSQIQMNLDGVICLMNDILVHAPDQTTHAKRVGAVLKRLQEAVLTLNEKCKSSKRSVKFLGHIIDANAFHADSSRVEAITNNPAPTSITELQRFMGMANWLAKFKPNLDEITAPLGQFLCEDTAWVWDQQQRTSF